MNTMKSSSTSFHNIDEYIALFPEGVQKKLEEIRSAIKAAAPDATEKISYQVPTFFLRGNLVHFAAFTHHISFFPSSSGIQAFAQELASYETSKGTIKFPIDSPIPLDLIRRITEYRVAENLAKTKSKTTRKQKA
jgi:uncharacterized protein YdhG (YjbR/CyaY superfamily)